MRKEWVKREHIYYRPFYKQKTKMLLLLLIVLAIGFFICQVYVVNQIPQSKRKWNLEQTINDMRRKHQEIMSSLGTKQKETDFPQFRYWRHAVRTESPIKLMRGTRILDFDKYRPNYAGNFRCLDGSREIPFTQVNDDYCDCPGDGSDEPSSNACGKGRFYCTHQREHEFGVGRDIFVPSSHVNDGVCDCCDGSDEWTTQAKCTNICNF